MKRKAVSRRVEKMYQEFERIALQGCPPMQKQEMKKAFFVGAFSVLDHLRNSIPDEMSEEEGVEIFQAIQRECQDFLLNLKR
jgi:hypothetical protein